MVNLSVKEVPEALAERLRQRAARNHRSLQGELMAILEHAMSEPERPPAALAPVPATVFAARAVVTGIGWGGRAILRRGYKQTEQIAAEHRLRFPEPIGGAPRTDETIRAEQEVK